MAHAIVNVRVDTDVKRGIEEFCEEVGMNVSTAVNLFFKAVLSQRKIPFEIAAPKPDLLEAIEDTRRRRNLHGPFPTAEEAVAAMLEE